MNSKSGLTTAPRSPLTRPAIIEMARGLVDEGGLDALSLRRLAADLGVTAPALYAHVRDKQDLLAELAETGFRELIGRYDGIDTTDPLQRIRRHCSLYVDLAVTSPGLFEVMFLFRPSAVEVPGDVRELPGATEAFAQATQAIADAIETGAIHPDHDPFLTSLVLWTAAHGLASVMSLGVSADPEGRARLETAVMDATLQGLGHPPL